MHPRLRMIIGIAAFVVVGWLLFSARPNPRESAAAPDAIPVSTSSQIAALGRIEPGLGVVKIGVPDADRLDRLLVEEGDWIEKGAVIGYLASYAESAAHVATIAARLEEEKKKIDAEKKYGEADVKQAMAKRDQTAAPTKFELESQTAKIDQLTAQLTFQQWNVERTKGLAISDSVSEKEYKQLDSDLLAKQAELASAKASLEKTKATSAADAATSNAMISLAMMGLEKSLVSSTVLSLEREKKEAEEQAERKIIRAPISAQVLRIITRPGETVGKDPILHIGDTRNMHALAEIYETEVDRIQVGQRAVIESPIFAKPLAGVVSQIGLAVYQSDIDNDDPANPKDARIVQVRIKLDNSSAASRYSNLQVRCKIELGERGGAKATESEASKSPVRAVEPTP